MRISLIWLCVCICLSKSQRVLRLELTEDTSDKNSVTYICSSTNRTVVLSTPRCCFVFSHPRSPGERGILNGTMEGSTLRVKVKVDPMNESVVFCKCEMEVEGNVLQSNNLSVAALQFAEKRQVNRLEFRENANVSVTLPCPYILGKLYNTDLQPYHICWSDTATPCTSSSGLQNSSDIILSSDNRSLTTNITAPSSNRTFSCALVLKRCNNDECPEMTSENVVFDIQVFDVLAVASPENDTTLHQNVGNLSCSAYGTNISSRWTVDNRAIDSNSDYVIKNTIIDTSYGKQLKSTITLNHGEVRGNISIMCEFDQTFVNGSVVSMNRTWLLIISSETTESVVSSETMTPSPATGSYALIIGASVSVIIICALIFLFCCIYCCCFRRSTGCIYCCCFQRSTGTKQYTVEAPSSNVVPSRPRKKDPIYEELPGPILGTEPQLMRQYGIDYDPTHCRNDNSSCQGSDEPLCGGSDVSGLSGVSGNIPGAHQMPRYNAEDSILSDNFLVPPQPWNRNVSNSTFNTATTQSTILESSSCSDDMTHNVDSRLYSSEVHYPRPPYAVPGRRYSYSDHPSGRISDRVHHSPSCHSCNQQIPFNNTPIVQSVGSSSSSLHKPAISTSSSRSNSAHNSPYHHSTNPSPYHHTMNPNPCRHHSAHSSPCHHHTNDSIPELANYLLNKVKHNRNCKIPGCFCKSLKELNNYEDNNVNKIHNTKRRKLSSTVTSSSTESESDTPDHKSKKKAMHLELKKDPEEELYPHYHLSTKSHAIHSSQRKVNSNKRRSQSLTDLTPITETQETPTPMVGGAVLVGTPVYPPKSLGDDGQIGECYIAPSKQALLTPGPAVSLTKPRPKLLRQTSISIDNLPVLCLNDCVAKLTTPSPTNQSIYLTNKVNRNGGILKTVQETVNNSESEVSNTSSRSKSPPEAEVVKSSQSDNEDTEFITHDPSLSRHGSLGYESCGGETGYSQKTELGTYSRFESSGYESSEGSISLRKGKKITDRTSKTKNGQKSKVPQPLPVDHDELSHINSGMSLNQYSSNSPKRNLTTSIFRTNNSPIPSRSPSPFETETEVREDGTKIQTTEC